MEKVNTMNNIIIVCAASQAILVAALGARVTSVRVKTGTMFHGERMDPGSALAKAVRAHGNAAEYAGMLMALFVLTGLAYGATPIDTWVSAVIMVISVARYLGAIGFLICTTLEKIHPLKALSAICTYIGTFAIGLNLLLKL